MGNYKSAAAPLFMRFEAYMQASGKWNPYAYGENLAAFDRYCKDNHPEATALTQEMVDGWCRKRDTEKSCSCRTRIQVVVSCIKYLNSRGLCLLQLPLLPKERNRYQYVPHHFTDDELDDLFSRCDAHAARKTLASRLKKVTLPVFFRLLFSTGMRPTEARLLRTENVDLLHGVIDIRQSKGHNQHFVVLHESMLKLMRAYDERVRRDDMCPNRAYFFPAADGGHHSREWVSGNFRSLWDTARFGKAVPYDLRHEYATRNLNQWVGLGVGFNARFVSLSKSMGHVSLESTKYYYSLVPCLADVMLNLTKDSFNEIVPDVDYGEEETE